jgi:glyoxylase-like metal-dependent hydrolase (beta-lactamase superfamily II)
MYPGYRNTAAHPAPIPPRAPPESTEMRVLPVQGGIYMVLGGGGNSVVQAGDDGVLVVDSKLAAQGEALLAAIRGISSKPLRYVINTSGAADKTGGNAALDRGGSTITGGNFAGANAGWGATLVAHENVAAWLTEANNEAIPSSTYFGAGKDLYFNGEAIRLHHPDSAHSDGDSIVHFRKSDVVATGDIFTPDRYPVIDLNHGGSINGVVRALNQILDLTVPAEKQEGGTMVIPGHGRLCDEADVVEYRDMVTIVRDRIQDAIKKGLTLAQVQAAGITRDYDPLYGPSTEFVEAAYRSLK